MEPTSYCGASRNHVFCINFVLNEQEPIKLFGRSEICEDVTWLDMENCSGTIDCKTFSLLPNLEFINMKGCNIKKIENDAFTALNHLELIDVRESTFAITSETFENSKLKCLHFSDLEINNEYLSSLRHLEKISFTNCTFSLINKLTFFEFSTLILTFSFCEITTIELDSFDNLKNLTDLSFMNCKIDQLDFQCLLNLHSLKIFSFYGNTLKSDMKYDLLKNLSLEKVLFELEVYKEMDFREYPRLKMIWLGLKDDEAEKAEEALRNSILLRCDEEYVGYEYVPTGKIDVDLKDVQICC